MLQDVMFLKHLALSSGTTQNSQLCLVTLCIARAEQTLLRITVLSPPFSAIICFSLTCAYWYIPPSILGGPVDSPCRLGFISDAIELSSLLESAFCLCSVFHCVMTLILNVLYFFRSVGFSIFYIRILMQLLFDQ